MATLKIVNLFGTSYWITDIREIGEIRRFALPEKSNPHSIDVDLMKLAFGDDPVPSNLTICDLTSNSEGKVLYISRKDREEHDGKIEVWIVPADSCYLLSDSGKTVDRI